jgi:uncharacterized lipoprotein YddW (UPF0748 family)
VKAHVASVWRHHRREGEVRIYTGRACRGYEASPLGKPAWMTRDKGPPLDQYRDWLREKLQTDTPQRREILRISHLLAEGQQVTLLCWCAKTNEGLDSSQEPYRCHAQVIAKVTEEVARRMLGAQDDRAQSGARDLP